MGAVVHQNLRKTFRRGKVQLRMEVLWAQDFKTGRVNRDVLAAYCEEMSAARRALGFVPDVDVERGALPRRARYAEVRGRRRFPATEEVFKELLDEAARVVE